MLVFYFILTFSLFFGQNFLPLSSPLRLDLLTLGLVFVSLRASLLVSVVLALLLGFTLDCYGTAPLGLQAGMFLTAVVGVKFLRHHLNFFYIIPQMAGVAVIILVQSVFMAVLLYLLFPAPELYPVLVQQTIIQMALTALSAPVFLALFNFLEKLWRRWFSIKT